MKLYVSINEAKWYVWSLSNVKTLALSTLGKIPAYDILKYLSYFSQKTGFDILYANRLQSSICIKGQNLFSGKNKKNITRLSSAEFAHRVVKAIQKI